MKISAISDVHDNPRSQLEKATGEMQDSDVVIIAGDISSNPEAYEKSLQRFSGLKAKKLIVLGNHDLYIEDNKKMDSFEKISLLERICTRNGFYLLDASPVIIGNIGFVGNIGWYDYEFAQTDSDEEIRVLSQNPYSIRVKNMKNRDFAVKRFLFKDRAGKFIEEAWNDINYIQWSFTDKEFLQLQLQKLNRHLKKIDNKVEKIVYVSHHVPIQEFVYSVKNNASWGIFNAYQGSPELGKIAFSNPKLKAIISGHSHIPNKKKIGNVDCYDVSREHGELKVEQISLN